MMKKILVIFCMLFMLTACSSSKYIPTAVISNIQYNEETEVIEFQVDVTDKSTTVKNATIELYDTKLLASIDFNKNKSLYSFDDIDKDGSYTIKIKATYEMNGTLLEDKEIANIDITNYISQQMTYFSSRTFTYTGEVYSIYLSNLDPIYTVKYENNDQSEVGIYEVVASVYLDNTFIIEYTAYLIITEDNPEIIVQNQAHYYTSKPINVEYKISNNAKTEILYNNKTEVPVECGEYHVDINVLNEDGEITTSAKIVMEIKKINIEIYTTNTLVVATGTPQSIDVKTNVDCDSIVTYNGSTTVPSAPGVYEVIITVEDSNNYYGLVKHITLTIANESDLNEVNELFISQVVYTNNYDIIIELYNPTNKSINLNGYSILVGDISHNKHIYLSGTIDSLSTYTIASTNTSYIDVSYNTKSSYLVAYDYEMLYLYNESILDEVQLNDGLNKIRKVSVSFPNEEYDIDEWDFYDNYVRASLNSHECNHLDYYLESYYEVVYKKEYYINFKEDIDFNNYIFVKTVAGVISITNDMIISNNINVNEFGTYSASFKIGNYEFTCKFIVSDLEAPLIEVNDVNLSFNINETIDFESLVTVSDISDISSFEYNVGALVVGVNEVEYIATDIYGNKSTLILYIFIK